MLIIEKPFGLINYPRCHELKGFVKLKQTNEQIHNCLSHDHLKKLVTTLLTPYEQLLGQQRQFLWYELKDSYSCKIVEVNNFGANPLHVSCAMGFVI